MAGSQKEIDRRETVADVVTEQRIAKLRNEARQTGFSLGETEGTQPALEELKEEIHRQVSEELGAIGNYLIATEELVGPGDIALFRAPRYSVIGQVESIGKGLIFGSNAGIRVDLTIVFTKDGQVLIGRGIIENSLVIASFKPTK